MKNEGMFSRTAPFGECRKRMRTTRRKKGKLLTGGKVACKGGMNGISLRSGKADVSVRS